MLSKVSVVVNPVSELKLEFYGGVPLMICLRPVCSQRAHTPAFHTDSEGQGEACATQQDLPALLSPGREL